MDRKIVSIFVDWGYTRLKLCAVNSKGKILEKIAYFNKDIIDNPIFYDDASLGSIKAIVAHFINSCNPCGCMHLYLSSQMHCLAGSLESGQKFLSTWNDLPLQRIFDQEVKILNGIPLLHSMPCNKLVKASNEYTVASEWSEKTFKKPEIPIAYAGSPLTLILSDLFATKLPCSKAWWQSSCLPAELLRHPSNGTTYESEYPIKVSRSHTIRNLGNDAVAFIYPETGDLQASTCHALHTQDIVINLGTGSQIVFRDLKADDTLRFTLFTRYWPTNPKPLVTISHLPCGRLLAAYAEARKMEIGLLKVALEELQAESIEDLANNNMTSILFFPGYCFVQDSYLQRPPVTLEEIAELKPCVLLSLWIYQYSSLIKRSLQLLDSNLLSIGITGSLGGMSPLFSRLLSAMLGPRLKVMCVASTLYLNQLSAFKRGVPT